MSVQQKFITSVKKGLVEITPMAGTDAANQSVTGISWWDMHVALRKIRKQMNNGGQDYYEFSNGARVQVRPTKVEQFKQSSLKRTLATIGEWWRFVFRKLGIGGKFKQVKVSHTTSNAQPLKTETPVPKNKPNIQQPASAMVSNYFEPFNNAPYKLSLRRMSGGLNQLNDQELLQQLTSSKRVTLGDLHGSFLKLVETLNNAKFVSISGDDMRIFTSVNLKLAKPLMHDPFLKKPENIKLVEQSLTQLEPLIKKMNWVDDSRQLVLIGDIVGDRGPLDIITLKVLKQLSKDKPDRIVTLFGNHDNAALDFIINPNNLDKIDTSPCDSLLSSNSFFTKTNRNKQELLDDYTWFLSRSKLAFYDKETQTLFSHAPITQQNVEEVLELLHKNKWLKQTPQQIMQSCDPDKVASVCDTLNAAFSAVVQNKQVLTKNSPFYNFIWQRDNKLDDYADLPFFNKGVKALVHGHTTKTEGSKFIIDEPKKDAAFTIVGLDNDCRKSAYLNQQSHCPYLIE